MHLILILEVLLKLKSKQGYITTALLHGELEEGENVYVEIPKVNLDTVIEKNSEVHEYIDDYFLNQQNVKDEWAKINQLSEHNIYEQSDKLFKELLKKEEEKEWKKE